MASTKLSARQELKAREAGRRIEMARRPVLAKVRDVHVPVSREVVSLVEQMGAAGGFMGRNLAEASDILYRMAADGGCTKFLSFPAAPVATGLRGVLVDMVKQGLVDVIVTASGTLDHDIARTEADYYHGSFDMDDAKLRREGYHRLGNLVIPLDSYGPLIERKVAPLLERLYGDGRTSLSSEELSSEIGRSLGRDSLLYWCWRK